MRSARKKLQLDLDDEKDVSNGLIGDDAVEPVGDNDGAAGVIEDDTARSEHLDSQRDPQEEFWDEKTIDKAVYGTYGSMFLVSVAGLLLL